MAKKISGEEGDRREQWYTLQSQNTGNSQRRSLSFRPWMQSDVLSKTPKLRILSFRERVRNMDEALFPSPVHKNSSSKQIKNNYSKITNKQIEEEGKKVDNVIGAISSKKKKPKTLELFD